MTSPAPQDARLTVAVIGAGKMGRNHLRCYARLPGVTIAAVVDPDPANRAAATADYGVPAVASLDELPKVDAVSIVTPSVTHAAIAERLIPRGIHCLIEKPLSVGSADGRRIVELAAQHQVTVAVGHLERFNPGIVALKDHLPSLGTLHGINARRLAKASRITDVDVVDDLMIHDLDVVLSLLDYPAIDLAQIDGVRGADVPGFDYATALLHVNGLLASFSASRLTPVRIRTLDVLGENGVATVDYIAQSLTIRRPGSNGQDEIETVAVERREPLLDELADFVAAITAGRAPRVPAAQAVIAITAVETIKASYKR